MVDDPSPLASDKYNKLGYFAHSWNVGILGYWKMESWVIETFLMTGIK